MADDYTILARPRIKLRTFIRILTAAGSPAAPRASECYAAIVAHGVDPALALAIFQHETSYGRKGIGPSTRNWGALRRSPHYASPSGFVRYPSWPAGAGDAARLLAIYGRNAIRRGTTTSTARTFPHVWAPTADGNAPARYGAAIVAAISRYIELERTAPKPPRPAPPAPIPTAATHRALADDVNLRTGPSTSANVVRQVDRGAAVRVDRLSPGSVYAVDGRQARTWYRITAIAGRRLVTPLWSASLLYTPIE